MSGFKKFTSEINNKNVISSGIETLDSLIDIVSGSVICFYEDKYSLIHNTLLQVINSSFLEISNGKSFLLCKENKLKVKYNRYQDTSDKLNDDPMLIAWRYQNLNNSKTYYNWDLLNKVDISDDCILDNLEDALYKMKTTKNCYFTMFSLFSPLYNIFVIEEIHKILFEIKKQARINNHTVIISMPQYLTENKFNNNFTVHFDAIFQIINNLTLPQETPLYCSLLEILKISTLGSLIVKPLESYKYGIVLKSKKIQIERIDIPPEDTTTNESCGAKF